MDVSRLWGGAVRPAVRSRPSLRSGRISGLRPSLVAAHAHVLVRKCPGAGQLAMQHAPAGAEGIPDPLSGGVTSGQD